MADPAYGQEKRHDCRCHGKTGEDQHGQADWRLENQPADGWLKQAATQQKQRRANDDRSRQVAVSHIGEVASRILFFDPFQLPLHVFQQSRQVAPMSEIKADCHDQVAKMLVLKCVLHLIQRLLDRHAAADTCQKVLNTLPHRRFYARLQAFFKGIEQVFTNLAPAGQQTGQLQRLLTDFGSLAIILPDHIDPPLHGRHGRPEPVES